MTTGAHRGPGGAIEAVLQGTSWQRCRAHFMRNALSLVPKTAQQMAGPTIRTVFAQPDAGSAHEQWLRVADGFRTIRERLGGSASMIEPFPEKPKGMRWKTYDTLWWKHHEAEMEQLAGTREWLDRLEKKAG